MAAIGPVVLDTVGDVFIQGARILAIIWEGATTVGDTVTLHCPKTNALLWKGRTNDTQTYLGGNIGPEGIHAPYGFQLTNISAGTVLVYLREN